MTERHSTVNPDRIRPALSADVCQLVTPVDCTLFCHLNYFVVGFYGLTCIFEIGEEIDVVTTTTTTSTLAFTRFPPTTTTEATTTTTVTTTTEPKVANAIFWGAKNIVKACIAIVTGFVILSVFAHGFWMIGTDSKSKARSTLVLFQKTSRNISKSDQREWFDSLDFTKWTLDS